MVPNNKIQPIRKQTNKNMVKKTILGIISIIIILITIQGAIADNMNDKITMILSMNNTHVDGTTVMDTLDNYNGSNDGGTTGQAGHLGEAIDLEDTDTDEINLEDNLDGNFTGNTSFSASVWVSHESSGGYDYILTFKEHSNIHLRYNSNTIELFAKEANDTAYTISQAGEPTGSWQLYIMTYDVATDNLCLYVNTTQIGCELVENFASGGISNCMGEQCHGANWADIDVDQTIVWNDYLLTSDNISALWNSGNGATYPFSAGAPPAGDEPSYNFTVFAQTSDDQDTITGFGATVNGTYYNTATNNIVTSIGNNTSIIVNITVNSTGFYDNTINNWNVTNNLTINLTPITQNVTISTTNTTLRTLTNISISCTISNNTGIINTERKVITNINDSTQIYTTDNNYTINLTDFYDRIEIWCEANTSYNEYNSTKVIIPINTIDTMANFNAIRHDGNGVVNPANFWFENSSLQENTTGTAQYLLSNFLNQTDKIKEETINITDPNGIHINTKTTINITETSNEYNITMNPAMLSLTYTSTVLGRICHGGVTSTTSTTAGNCSNFNETNLTVIQENLSIGPVHIEFAKTSWENATQFYEYINNGTTTATETIYIMSNPKITNWVKVESLTSTPLENAYIRMYILNSTVPEFPTWTEHSLMGQRLTNSEGKTFIMADYGSSLIIHVWAEGYGITSYRFTVGDVSYTSDEPLIIRLRPGDITGGENSWIFIQNHFYNRSLNIQAGITSLDTDSLTYTTQYRIDNNLNNKTTNCDGFGRCTLNMISGTDFSNTGNDNITLIVWRNNDLLFNRTITYRTGEITNQIIPESTLTSLDTRLLEIILGICIIILSAGISYLFHNEELGIGAFKIMSIIAVIISASYIWLTVVILSGYLLEQMRRIFQE